MSAEIKTGMANQEPHKSKRLSSFIWILVLWLVIYLISGMDGISWKRAFWIEASSWGAIPATLLLLCALFFPLRYQSIFRWAAFGAVCLGFIGGLILGGYFHENTTPAETDYFFLRQLIYPLLVIVWVMAKLIKEVKHGLFK
jgi:hypothetical protein